MSDPDTPAGTAELLSSGPDRDRWRPSRRLVLTTIAAVALVVGVGGPSLWMRHERTLDDLAARQVRLLAGALVELEGGYRAQVVNVGPAPVQVLDVALRGPGHQARTTGARLAPGASLDLLLPYGTGCDARAPLFAPHALLLHARTARGHVVTRTAELDEPSAAVVSRSERGRCGFLTPVEAVTFSPLSSSVRGRTVVVRGLLFNRSATRVTLERLTAVPGLAVAARLPVILAAAVPGQGQPTEVSLTLQVTDCRAFAASLQRARRPLPRQLLGLMRSAYGEGLVTLDLVRLEPPSAGLPTVPTLELLTETCPG